MQLSLKNAALNQNAALGTQGAKQKRPAFPLALPFYLTLLALLSAPTSPMASIPIVIDDKLTTLNIGNKMDLLEDPLHQFSIEDVSYGSASNQFEKCTTDNPNYGFTNSAFWARFWLKNNGDKPRDVLLELNYGAMDKITLFQRNSSRQFTSVTLGDQFPIENRKIQNRNPIFHLKVPPASTTDYYVRLHTEGSMQIPLRLHETFAFLKVDHTTQISFGLYFGIVFVMGFYNLFLFIAIRDKTYLYYVVFITSVALFNMTLSGLAYELFLHKFQLIVNKAILFLIIIIGISGALFTMSFLQTKQTAPSTHKLLIAFSVLLGALFIGIIFGSYSLFGRILLFVTITWAFLLTGTGIYVLRKGYRPARFYVLAWIALLTGIALQAFRLAGILPNVFITQYGMEIGSGLEVVLLSLALADRITIMKQEKEDAQKHAIESFRKADKIKNDFLANTSHELRTPLNGIIGIAESLLNGVAGAVNKRTKENLGLIVNAGQRLSRLVNDILDFAKIRNKGLELTLKPVSLKEIVDLEIALLSPLLQSKDVGLKNEIPSNLSAVKADENRLIQILHNLIGNSIKFTVSGSISVLAEHQDDIVVIEIVDTGIGIPEEKMGDIFVAFEQADGSSAREFGGTGIGLSITKQLVELHGGTITAKSKPGVGTTISFCLLATDEKAKSIDFISPISFAPRPNYSEQDLETDNLIPVDYEEGMHILAVDDEPINLQVLSNHLSLQGHKISLATDGEQALEFIRNNGKPDLILLDVMMPKITGIEVCKILREKYSPADLPIILVTAKNQLSDLLCGFSVGANDYLTKPFSIHEVLARIRVQKQISDFSSALADANEKLRVQIVKRSDQLFSTLAMIARGSTEIKRLEKGTIVANCYQIQRTLGEGGMGTVYEANILATNQRAALKVAKSGDPSALARLAQEARMAVEVIHENIVHVIDVDIADDGFLYIVMEYLDGMSLDKLADKWGDLDWGQKVLHQIITGLSELHRRNLVHRDLKPGNFVVVSNPVTQEFTVKIVDFGISGWEHATKDKELPRLGELMSNSSWTRPLKQPRAKTSVPAPNSHWPESPFGADFDSGEATVKPFTDNRLKTFQASDIMGTPRFMAPEQIIHRSHPTLSTDVWSFGVVAHRILAKSWPISKEKFSDLLTGVGISDTLSILEGAPKLNPKIAATIDRCLSINPDNRPTADELVEIFSETTKF